MNKSTAIRLKIKLLALAALGAGIAGGSLHGASVPYVGTLTFAAPITVPAGKILIIEHICYGVNAPGSFAVGVLYLTLSGTNTSGIGSAGNYSVQVQYVIGAIGGYTPATVATASGQSSQASGPATSGVLRVGEGSTLSVTNGPQGQGYTVLGTVIDTADFYASANPVVKRLTNDGSQLAMIVDSRTLRETLASGESSRDLKTWTTADVKVARSSSNHRISKVTTPADSPKKFLRAKLRDTLMASTEN